MHRPAVHKSKPSAMFYTLFCCLGRVLSQKDPVNSQTQRKFLRCAFTGGVTPKNVRVAAGRRDDVAHLAFLPLPLVFGKDGDGAARVRPSSAKMTTKSRISRFTAAALTV
ncbi:hypothetical protein AOLI_G00029830 [Acnodon oligacanthus]